jgi:hypothetical protein
MVKRKVEQDTHLFELPPSTRRQPTLLQACGEVSPPNPLVSPVTDKRLPPHVCQRPAGHDGYHQRIRRKDFRVMSAWVDGVWVLAPEKKVSR